MANEKIIRDHLAFLYGGKISKSVWLQLRQQLDEFRNRNLRSKKRIVSSTECWTERDLFLITYSDQIREPGKPPLQSLAEFLDEYLVDAFSGVHLLPFHPYSSDDGFSVIDYRQVDPELGTWDNISQIGQNFRLIFDAVINHVSRKSKWFKAYLKNQEPYAGYFIDVAPSVDLSEVVRPRDLPLLTPFETAGGVRHVWTTFSHDQIDLNYANPKVLLEIIDLLLFYVERGADIIRLDAIAYLWKEIGTSCLHLPQAHRVVKLFRAILESVAPEVLLVTETNVPHDENISYFGEPLPGTDKVDEAQMVYQFPLVPLVLHTFYTGCARTLSRWVASLETPSSMSTFFNFLASHDGIGVIPARELLSDDEVEALAERTLTHGGELSYKVNPDGSRNVYELNITLFDFLNHPGHPQPELDSRRFLAAQVILLSLAGVPGIYIHSLFGSRNYREGVNKTGCARSINREKFHRVTLEAELADFNSLKHKIFSEFLHLIHQRKNHPAFHPTSEQRVLFLDDNLFTLIRTAVNGETILCIVNVGHRGKVIYLYPKEWNLPETDIWRDLIEGINYPVKEKCLSISMEPYKALWLFSEPESAG